MNGMLSKEQILDATNGGLDVFEFFIKGFPGPNKAFLNPFTMTITPLCTYIKVLGNPLIDLSILETTPIMEIASTT